MDKDPDGPKRTSIILSKMPTNCYYCVVETFGYILLILIDEKRNLSHGLTLCFVVLISSLIGKFIPLHSISQLYLLPGIDYTLSIIPSRARTDVSERETLWLQET